MKIFGPEIPLHAFKLIHTEPYMQGEAKSIPLQFLQFLENLNTV